VAEFADRVALLAAGRLVRVAPSSSFFQEVEFLAKHRCDRPRSLSFFTASGNAGSRWTLCRLLWQKRYPLTRRCAHA